MKKRQKQVGQRLENWATLPGIEAWYLLGVLVGGLKGGGAVGRGGTTAATTWQPLCHDPNECQQTPPPTIATLSLALTLTVSRFASYYAY